MRRSINRAALVRNRKLRRNWLLFHSIVFNIHEVCKFKGFLTVWRTTTLFYHVFFPVPYSNFWKSCRCQECKNRSIERWFHNAKSFVDCFREITSLKMKITVNIKRQHVLYVWREINQSAKIVFCCFEFYKYHKLKWQWSSNF